MTDPLSPPSPTAAPEKTVPELLKQVAVLQAMVGRVEELSCLWMVRAEKAEATLNELMTEKLSPPFPPPDQIEELLARWREYQQRHETTAASFAVIRESHHAARHREAVGAYERCIEELSAALAPAKEDPLADAAEMLWIVVANVSGGDWTKQSEEWQEAAARWRDNYFRVLKAVDQTRVSRADAPEHGGLR